MDPCCVEEVKEDIEFYIEANEGMEGGDDMDPYEVRAQGHAYRSLFWFMAISGSSRWYE